MDENHESLQEYNTEKKLKWFIVFDDVIADMSSN